MATSLALEDGIYQVGLTKVFFKKGAFGELEGKRTKCWKTAAIKLQAHVRRGAWGCAGMGCRPMCVGVPGVCRDGVQGTWCGGGESGWWVFVCVLSPWGPILCGKEKGGHARMCVCVSTSPSLLHALCVCVMCWLSLCVCLPCMRMSPPLQTRMLQARRKWRKFQPAVLRMQVSVTPVGVLAGARWPDA
jgi:hypothetical protein